MRIIGGSASGRILTTPKGQAVRPTPDRVREALFNSLGARVVDANVLELFGGTGALSLEALSRGASRAACVEKAHKHCAFIRKNAQSIGFGASKLTIRAEDVFEFARREREGPQRYNIIFADPPYGDKTNGARSQSLAQKTADSPDVFELLAPGGLFLLGHAKRDEVVPPDTWELQKRFQHGDNVFLALIPANPS